MKKKTFFYVVCMFLCLSHHDCVSSGVETSHPSTLSESTHNLKDSILEAGSSLLKKVENNLLKVEKKVGDSIEKVGENIKKAFPPATENVDQPQTEQYSQKDQTITPVPDVRTASFESSSSPPSFDMFDASPLVDRASPAIVNIHVKYHTAYVHPFFNDPFFMSFFGMQNQILPRHEKEQSIGSGSIIRKDGIVLTCAHVIEKADEIRVSLKDGREFPAKVIFINEGEDIAFLKLDLSQTLIKKGQISSQSLDTDLPTLPLAMRDEPKVGRFILAMGYAQGQPLTTFGMISSVGAMSLMEGARDHDALMMVTAEMGPGMSGGALLNLKGEIIGILNAILVKRAHLTKHGIAIPIGLALKYLRTMDEKGDIKKPWHGMDVKPVLSSMKHNHGGGNFINPHEKNADVMVVRTAKDSPASRAGMLEGDIIVSVNNKTLHHFQDFKKALATQGVGDVVTCVIRRKDEEKTIQYTVEEKPNLAAQNIILQKGLFKGLSLQVTEDHQGFEIVDIPSSSMAAASLGLQKGDVLKTLNQKPITSEKHLEIEQASGLSLEVQRGEHVFSTFLNVHPHGYTTQQTFF